MNIRVPEELIILAKIFNKNKEKLYIVGGFVRNQILGIPDKYNLDIDICSSALPEKVVSMLENSKFSTRYMSEESGVLEIKGNIRVEHATFRTEKYNLPGVHVPNNVEFIKDINIDAKRRDFTCNAIYYDILENEIIDPFNGVKDIYSKIIRTVIEPQEVFKNDAERILRMVRFACTLGFNIEEKTYKEAKNNIHKIKFLSAQRKREEFSKIVLADTKFNFLTDIKHAHTRGIKILLDLNAMEFLLPALHAINNSGIIEDRGKPLIDHIINVFDFSKPEVRLSALLHDVGKARAILEFRKFLGAREFADVIIEANLGQEGLCFPKKVVERVKKVVSGLDFNKYCLETERNIKIFIIENIDIIELILALKNAVAFDKSKMKRYSLSSYRLLKVYNKMIATHTPTNVNELKIKGDEIIKLYPTIKLNTLSILLKNILLKVINRPALNNKKDIVKILEKLIKSKKDYYLE